MPCISVEVLTTDRSTEAEAGVGCGGHMNAGVLQAREQVLAEARKGLGTKQLPK